MTTVSDCPEIIVDGKNNRDIVTYVDQRLSLGITDDNPEKKALKMKFSKSRLAYSSGSP